MKVLCVALILPNYVIWQVYDNFSDGDFTNITIEVERTVKASDRIYDKKGTLQKLLLFD